MHNFYMPRPPRPSLSHNPSSPEPSSRQDGDVESSALDSLTTFRVFGMTARILVDAARVAYGEEPEFEHNSHHGDEEMIARLLKMGRLRLERKKGELLTKEVLREASKL
jgi:hypothetical protein